VIAGVLGLGLVAVALLHSWWAVVRGPDLLARTDNARRAIADRYVVRGQILDRNNTPITVTVGTSGDLKRIYRFPDMSPIIGYTHPIFGQAGLEASLDAFLRGLQGNPTGLLVWNELLYGTPPHGLDMRLTVDIALQVIADGMLGDREGAVVLMNAQSGEILAMASHPSYNANELDSIGAQLLQDEGRPLLNRAAQGAYALHDAALPFITASELDRGEAVLDALYRALGFYSVPEIRMPVAQVAEGAASGALRISPLQMAIAAATLSNGGIRPHPRIALAVNTPSEGWVVLPALGQPQTVFSAKAAESAATHYGVPGTAIWQWRTTAASPRQILTWYIAGTLPGWQGTPLVVVVLLEDADVAAATDIGRVLMGEAGNP
jgi:cell division protein FtsI/penicillin-binding protein 2